MDARLRILEVLYRFDLDEASHVRLVQETASRYWQKRGPVALVTGRLLRDGAFELSPPHVTRDEGGGYGQVIRDVFLKVSADVLHTCFSLSPLYGGVMEPRLSGVLSDQLTTPVMRDAGGGDILGFYSGTREGGMVGLMTFLDRLSATSPRERAHWQPLAAHLAAAWRLRHRVDAGAAMEDLADAVFRPDGHVSECRVHMHETVRERLRALVRGRERERSNRTASSGMWSELMEGQWTFIDHFEAGGRRVVIAVRNTPMGESLCRLTAREVDALTQARKGSSNKEIGLHMNLSTSSVTRVLQSAARKLNAALSDILQFGAADTVRCRELLLGESSLSMISQDTVDEWRRALSEAENTIVTAVLRGHSNREIATMRGRSVRTVVNQLASAFEKLGVRSRREMMNRASGLALADTAEARGGSPGRC